MSLLPYILDAYTRPSRLLDQHFGLSLDSDDLLSPITDPSILATCLRSHPTMGYIRPWRTSVSQRDVGSTISMDKERFQANLDVQQFKPEEITVKATGNNVITIEGKHEEKQDDHGYISRQFVRKYVIPKECDYEKIESKLSSDGVLTITAPRINVDKSIDHKTIPIIKTGHPAKVEQKKVEEKKPENAEK
ncbi:protein lethal(2)essential for life-like [Harmonia axyridis]|uniref:Heat shock protein 21.62 n=1 Tax=Harmonia axyridis TaxID=115357 RepID=A0A2U3TA37_HARAX|nr:protein lethal(2)essential for life-like [Harmonia axyridis]ART30114.1 heat shock protein 21.62 [Harmonia axyridis]